MTSQNRTPAAKLHNDKRKLKGIKRKHDHDQSRRGYFAGLVDSNPKASPTELAVLANKQFEENGDEPISERTVRRWKLLLKCDRKDFLAGISLRALRLDCAALCPPRVLHVVVFVNTRQTVRRVSLVCSVRLSRFVSLSFCLSVSLCVSCVCMCSGCHYSSAGRVRLSDADVEVIRDFVLAHRHDSLADNAAAIKEQKGIDVSKSWIDYLAKTDPDRLHVGSFSGCLCLFRVSHLSLFRPSKCSPSLSRPRSTRRREWISALSTATRTGACTSGPASSPSIRAGRKVRACVFRTDTLCRWLLLGAVQG